MERSAEIFTAAVLGTIAHKNGYAAIPCQDTELMKMMSGKQVGEGLPLLDAWTKAWHDANLAGLFSM